MHLFFPCASLHMVCIYIWTTERRSWTFDGIFQLFSNLRSENT